MNNTFYLVFVTFCGVISYGTEEETYLVGVSLNMDNAEAVVEKYSKSIEPFAPDFNFKEYFGDTVLDHTCAENIEDDKRELYRPVRYRDGFYKIVKFDGNPAFVTSNGYLE